MSAKVLTFRPADADLEAAWIAYDTARLKVEALYLDETSTAPQRREAVLEAEQLLQKLRNLWRRAGVV